MRQGSSDASNANLPGGSTARGGERLRRLPARERRIKDIALDDYRVRVLGTVVDTDEGGGTALLDDGTGRAVILFADPEQFSSVKEGQRVRVIGRARKDAEIEIEVEVIQDMGGLDLELYKQVRYMEEKLERCNHV